MLSGKLENIKNMKPRKTPLKITKFKHDSTFTWCNLVTSNKSTNLYENAPLAYVVPSCSEFLSSNPFFLLWRCFLCLLQWSDDFLSILHK